MVVLMGMTAIRQLGFFVKFNTFGVIFVLLIMTFIVGTGVNGFATTHYTFSEPANPEQKDPFYIKLFSGNFAPLMGILGGGYYLHNITLPIIKNSAKPENNARDVFIGYLLVFISYTLCGLMGYFGFSGT
jgi:sodium-coupled neutral amino acid transporter 9